MVQLERLLLAALIWPSLRRIERDMDKKENIVLNENSTDFGLPRRRYTYVALTQIPTDFTNFIEFI